MKAVVLLLALGLAAASATKTYKICIPEVVADACERMILAAKAKNINMQCIPARDRIECVEKVRSDVADFEAVEPEDMYWAQQLENDAFSVFSEIRTKEEPSAEHRYEAVFVIHKDLNINSPKELRGLKSCHTGVGRNVGYKIPITKLTKMGILDPMNDVSLSPRENELKALSTFFSKSCLVGTWSPHPETNKKLKQTYSNLCELCEHPDKCDYPDANSGYEGALRCLAKAGGDIAFTKVIFVKKFFGMAYGTQPAVHSEYNPNDFAYFCPDGTKKPITGTPCTWAARPWPGFMASSTLNNNEIKELSNEIATLNNIGDSSHADWIAKVLTLSDKTLPVAVAPHSPKNHLEKAKYLDVIERDVLEPRRLVRICTQTPVEMEKCEKLKVAAYSRDIRPSLSCIKSENCLHDVHAKKAELVILDPHQAMLAERHHLKPLLNEQFNGASEQAIVAAVKKGSGIGSLQQLKGKKACLPPNNSAGFFGVLKYLLNNNFISKTHCPYEKSLEEFFSTVNQSPDPEECLSKGSGDVAFVPLSSLHKDAANDIQIICSSGGLVSIDKAESCGLVTIPPRLVMTCNELTEVQIDEARQSLLSAAKLFGSKPEIFHLFGDFNGQPNILFSNHANGLINIPDVLPSYELYKKLVSGLSICEV